MLQEKYSMEILQLLLQLYFSDKLKIMTQRSTSSNKKNKTSFYFTNALFHPNTFLTHLTIRHCWQCPSDADSEAVWETADVTLERGASGLGLSIAGGETGSDVSITRLAVGGAAQKDGRLQIGDILLQVSIVINYLSGQ